MKPPLDPTRSPWIIAHRGGRLDAPENTRAAFDAALACPIDGIELDIQMTRDGVAVLHHDGNLLKINGGRGRISDFNYEELIGMDWGGWYGDTFAGERIVSLEETVRLYGGRTRLLIEIKSFLRDRRHGRSLDITREVLRVVSQNTTPPGQPNVFILSFDREVLNYAHDIQPGWNYVWNLPPHFTAVAANSPPDYLYALCLPVSKINPDFVEYAHGRGMHTMTYSCNIPRQVHKAWQAAADVIMTDRPRWITDYLRSPGMNHDS